MRQVFVAAILICGCGQIPPQETKQTSNKDAKIQLLFEHDGVKVYRFYDMPVGYVYYTDARGKTEWTTTQQVGDTPVTEKHQVPNE